MRETSRDESQYVPSLEKLVRTRDLELPMFEGSLLSCSLHSAGYTRTSVHPYFPVAKSSRNHYLSGTVLRDTARLSQRYPPIARYGVFGVSIWPIGCDTPSPFSERFPLGQHANWRCDTPPPPQKGYLSDTCAIHYENKAKRVRYPSLRYYFEIGYCAIWGGFSHWAAKIITYSMLF